MTVRRPVPIGARFGRWTVVGDCAADPRNGTVVPCRCDCGTERDLRVAKLRFGRTRSCGCLRADAARSGMVTHGASIGGMRTPEYTAWKNMIARCENRGRREWMRYGGRGISVCDRWRSSFPAFLADVGPRPPGTTLDRINRDGNYEPGNVRWATWLAQQRNRNNNHRVTANGVTMSLAEWQERTGIPASTIRQRLARGMSPEAALSSTGRVGT